MKWFTFIGGQVYALYRVRLQNKIPRGESGMPGFPSMALKEQMGSLFEVHAIDQRFYQDRLQDFLPARLIDVHTHVWLHRFSSKEKDENVRAVTWPHRVALDNS